jgi:protease I
VNTNGSGCDGGCSNGQTQSGPLAGRRYAILSETNFEQDELIQPAKGLKNAGAAVDIVSPRSGEIQGMRHDQRGDKVLVDRPLDVANPEDYDGLVLPGGVMNPDALRMNPKALAFVRHFTSAHKPIAAICHGPWTLIEVDAVRGRRVTSWPSLKTDLKNAGAQWVDQEVVVEPGLVTSRKPADLPAFNREMIRMFEQAPSRRHPQAQAPA